MRITKQGKVEAEKSAYTLYILGIINAVQYDKILAEIDKQANGNNSNS